MASNEKRPSIMRRIMRLFNFILFVFLPVLLVAAILWTGFRAGQEFVVQYGGYAAIQGRQVNYQTTATAISAEAHYGASEGHSVRLVQFATNTPGGNDQSVTPTVEPTQSSSDASGFPTNTPPVTPTPEISPTQPVATLDLDAPRTPIALPTFMRAPEREIAEIAGTSVPTQVPIIPRDYELVNILLLGSDQEIVGDNSIRTDTMIVVSVNMDTGTVSMLSLPRDLFVYIPTPSMQRLNTVYGIGENFGWSGGGFGLMRQTIFHNFGIQLHYYALVNLSGMRELIDALGGVEIAVDCVYQDYALVNVDVPEAAMLTDAEAGIWTLPVGYYQMSGGEALWYARTRSEGRADDFDRGRRQQQLLLAIFRAARANGQLAQLPELWNQMTQVVQTDVPFDVMLQLLPIGLNLDPASIENFVMTRTYHTTPWQPPSGALAGQYVQLPNYDPIRQLLEDFYQPPTENQVALAARTVAVYNGTNNAAWDRIVAERLVSRGFDAFAAGRIDDTDVQITRLVDLSGEQKSSLILPLVQELEIASENVSIAPDPNRMADYEIVVGSDYGDKLCQGTVLAPTP